MVYGDTTWSGLFSLFALAAVAALYFLPTIIANTRGHQNTGGVFLINLLLGWSVIGWVIALVMAAGTVQKAPAAIVPSRPPSPMLERTTERQRGPRPENETTVRCMSCGTVINRVSLECFKCKTPTAKSIEAARVAAATPTERPCPFCETSISVTAKEVPAVRGVGRARVRADAGVMRV